MRAMRRLMALSTDLIVIGLCLGPVAGAQTIRPRVPPPGEAEYRRALYPRGLPRRENPLSQSMAQPEFVLDAHAPLPGTQREVIVFSEAITKAVPSDGV